MRLMFHDRIPTVYADNCDRRKEKVMDFYRIQNYFSKQLQQALLIWLKQDRRLEEIRLRVNRPLFIRYGGQESMIDKRGDITTKEIDAVKISGNDLQEIFLKMSEYSFYAYEDEIRQGYLTTKEGCRVGICGKVVCDSGKIKTIHHISSLNIRFPYENKGCSKWLLPYLFNENQVEHTLIISPPMCGKTTLLRDLIKQLSDGSDSIDGKTVGVVDERGEICACHLGIPQNDMGNKTDVLDGCPKVEGMMMLVRTMSPEVIAIDEVGSKQEFDAMEYAMNCGCSILATIHGNHLEEVLHKNKTILEEKKSFFKRYLVLSRRNGAGTIEGIYDENGHTIWKGKDI